MIDIYINSKMTEMFSAPYYSVAVFYGMLGSQTTHCVVYLIIVLSLIPFIVIIIVDPPID